MHLGMFRCPRLPTEKSAIFFDDIGSGGPAARLLAAVVDGSAAKLTCEAGGGLTNIDNAHDT